MSDAEARVQAELRGLLDWLIDQAIAHRPFPAVVATLKRQAPGRFPTLLGAHSESDPVRGLIRIAALVWSEIPQPRLRYATESVFPGPFEPCLCSSGAPFHHCCGPQLAASEFRNEQSMLAQLLERLPPERLSELRDAAVDLDDLALALRGWLDRGRSQAVCDLLLPWLSDALRAPAHPALLHLLLDALDDQGRVDAFAEVLGQATRSAHPSLAANGWTRLAGMYGDAGAFDRAWACFREAQRRKPGDEGLAVVELTLLMNEGREAETRERAVFYQRQMKRDGGGSEQVRAFIDDAASFGGAALLQWGNPDGEWLWELFEILLELPPPQSDYEVRQGRLQLPEAAARAVSGWLARLVDGDLAAGDDPPWFAALKDDAALLDRFEVLAALIGWLHRREPVAADHSLLPALAGRAASLAESGGLHALPTGANAALETCLREYRRLFEPALAEPLITRVLSEGLPEPGNHD